MRLTVLGLTLLLSAVPTRAQSQPFAERGDIALVAQLSLGGGLSPAYGGIGARYWTSNRTVVGGSLGADVRSVRQETAGFEGTNRFRQVVTTLWVEQHMAAKHRGVSPFVALGVTGGAARVSTGSTAPGEPVLDRTATQYSLGAGVGLGAEVRLAPGVTLGAAYTVGVTASRSTSAQTPGDPAQTRTDVGLGIGVTPLHLSVYF